MIPTDFQPHERGDGRRFHVRIFGDEWQVYGLGVEHIAICLRRECADMVADALEFHAAELEIRKRCHVRYSRITPLELFGGEP